MLDYVNVDERIKIKNVSDLLKHDVVIYVNKFNEDAVDEFATAFAAAHETGQEIIPIVIDSYGGQVYSLLAMVDLIKSSDKTIATIVMGKAMSCGAVLLTCGTEGYRFASPTSTIMIHDVSSGAWGKIEEMKADVKEGERLNKIIFDLMDKNCGLKKNTLLDKLRKEQNSTDWYLTPTQAKKLNVVNHVKVPKLITTVSVKTELL